MARPSRLDDPDPSPLGGGSATRWLYLCRVKGSSARRQQAVWFILGASLALPPVLLRLDALRLGPGCLFRHITRLPCPVCGYTRAFAALGRGEWRIALEQAPLSVPLFLAAWAVMLVSLMLVLLRARLGCDAGFFRRSRWRRHLLWMIPVGLLLIDWSYRLAMALGYRWPPGVAAGVAN